MHRRFLTTASVAAAALLASFIALSPHGAAADEPATVDAPAIEAQGVAPQTQTIVRNRVLRSTTVVTNEVFSGTEIPGGAHYLHDPIPILCPRDTAGACTIEVEIFVQLLSSEANNWASACAQVDGLSVPSVGCPFLGYISQGVFGGHSISMAKSGVPRGRRMVQARIFSAQAKFLGNWTVIYRVYKPN